MPVLLREAVLNRKSSGAGGEGMWAGGGCSTCPQGSKALGVWPIIIRKEGGAARRAGIITTRSSR